MKIRIVDNNFLDSLVYLHSGGVHLTRLLLLRRHSIALILLFVDKLDIKVVVIVVLDVIHSLLLILLLFIIRIAIEFAEKDHSLMYGDVIIIIVVLLLSIHQFTVEDDPSRAHLLSPEGHRLGPPTIGLQRGHSTLLILQLSLLIASNVRLREDGQNETVRRAVEGWNGGGRRERGGGAGGGRGGGRLCLLLLMIIRLSNGNGSGSAV